MAVVLSARLMVRYADKYDPDLALGVREAGARSCRRRSREHVDADARRPVAPPTRRARSAATSSC